MWRGLLAPTDTSLYATPHQCDADPSWGPLFILLYHVTFFLRAILNLICLNWRRRRSLQVTAGYRRLPAVTRVPETKNFSDRESWSVLSPLRVRGSPQVTPGDPR